MWVRVQITVIHASKLAFHFNISHNFDFFGGVAHLLSYNISHVIYIRYHETHNINYQLNLAFSKAHRLEEAC